MNDSGTRPGENSEKKRFYAGVAIVILAGVLLYAPSLGYDFIWDDRDLILKNYWLTSGASLADVLLNSIHYHAYWRPLTIFSFYVGYSIAGPAPMLFHGMQLLIHAAVILLVIIWANMLTENRRIAVLSGLLFALHPMVSETVCFISARCNMFATAGFLGALIGSHLIYQKRIPLGLGVYTIAAFVGIWAKESGVMILAIPFVYWIYALLKENLRPAAKVLWKPYALATLAGSVIAAGYLVMRAMVIRNIDSGHVLQADGNLVVNVIYRLPYWLGQMIMPVVSNPDYQFFGKQLTVFMIATGAFSTLIILTGLVFLWRAKQWKWLLCALLWLMVISPFMGFINPMGRTFSESWMYMALPFFAIPLAAVLFMGISRDKIRKIALLLLIGVVMGYGVLSIGHAEKWQNQKTLNAAAIEANPLNAKALHNYADELYQEGDKAGAKKVLWHITANVPRYTHAYEFLAILYLEDKEYLKAEKIVRLGLEKCRVKSRLYGILAQIMLDTNRPEEVLEVLDKSPDDLQFREKAPLKAAALLHLNRVDEALEILKPYVEDYPMDTSAASLYKMLLKKKNSAQ